MFCFFRSFVPPVRDEESETQRKAHAKRVRETRRSTQGVTLEEVKTAEQLAKKKQAETVGFKNNKSLLATNQLDIGGKKYADYFNTFSWTRVGANEWFKIWIGAAAIVEIMHQR